MGDIVGVVWEASTPQAARSRQLGEIVPVRIVGITKTYFECRWFYLVGSSDFEYGEDMETEPCAQQFESVVCSFSMFDSLEKYEGCRSVHKGKARLI